MKKGILSVVLALCICISSKSAAYAGQEGSLWKENILTEESTPGRMVRESTIPTPSEIYESMIALKDQEAYQEGTPWTDYEPYSDEKGYYHWKGGLLDGKRISAVGCVAFAFILSDAAFGELPARMYAAGEFKYEDIKAGDILRVNNDVHTVIVLEVSDSGVIVAEGNISTGDHKGRVHWGRAISKAEVINNASHYITRYPEGYVPPDDPDANVSIADGSLDGGLTWNLTKAGTLTISGNGAMPDFSSTGEQPWNKNSSQIRKVVIEDGITSIGSGAFWNCGVLGVEISSSVTTIGNHAFRGSSIITVTIPSSVKTIGDSAFRDCQNLSSVDIYEGLEKIEQNAFRACTKLTSIDFPASIGEVGSGSFFQCKALVSAVFAPGSKQVTLGENLFTQCYYLMRVTLPKNIDRIGAGMFQNCLMLPGVEIPQGVDSIGESAFASCNAFTTVLIPDSVTTIEPGAFSSCSLKTVYFTGTKAQWNSISKGGDVAAAVSKATMHYDYVPPSISDPDDGDGNDGENPGGGNNPGDSETPGGGDNPGDSETPGGDNNPGDSETPGGGNNPGDSETPGSNETPSGGDVPGSSDNSGSGQTTLKEGETFTINQVTYQVTKAGEEVELLISASTEANVIIDTVTGTDGVEYKVTSIGSKAIQNNKKMTKLVIGSNVKAIGANAFLGCTKLKTLTIGKNVTEIGAGAFKGCTSLKKIITLPDSIKTIGTAAFSGCKNITAVTIGKTSKSSLTTIGKSAFNGCKKLKKVTIKSTKLNSVGKQAFKGAKSGLKVKVPSKQLRKYKNLLKKSGLKVNKVIK